MLLSKSFFMWYNLNYIPFSPMANPYLPKKLLKIFFVGAGLTLLALIFLVYHGQLPIRNWFSFWPRAEERPTGTYPKLALYWTSPFMTLEQAQQASRYDLIVADMENMINNRASLAVIKNINPRAKLVAYANPMEFFNYIDPTARPLQAQMINAAALGDNRWRLRTPAGGPVIFYPGMSMNNLSDWCPAVNGQKWNEYSANFFLQRVLFDPIWDGFFLDNATENISWIYNGWIDADNNGQPDDPMALDKSWQAGISRFLQVIMDAKGKNFILIGNKGSLAFLDQTGGKMFEHFPNDYLGDKKDNGWWQSMSNYAQTGPYSILNAEEKQGRQYWQFVLASTLMGDGYFSYGQNNLSWFNEYRPLGQPVAAAKKAGDCWERQFTQGKVRACPKNQTGQITYDRK